PAQADRQDRCSAAAHRGRNLRLLRGDGRAHRAQAPRSPPDRDPVDRSPGAPRAARKSVSRRLRRLDEAPLKATKSGAKECIATIEASDEAPLKATKTARAPVIKRVGWAKPRLRFR